MNRRHLLKLLAASAAYTQLPHCARPVARAFPITVSGADPARGHRLRTMDLPAPTEHRSTAVVIIGAGVAGLSAARALAKSGMHDFVVLDLEREAGGNARSGSSAVGRFPLGAHYLPVPDPADTELLDLLRECGTSTGLDERTGLPILNEEHLCADPHERLFHNGVWRSGLRPRVALVAEEEAQFHRFEAFVERCAQRKGADGRWAFAIPVDRSSRSPELEDLHALDRITLGAWMEQQGFTGPAIRWYLNYCCLDDFGAGIDQVSAWAGIHYFAARRGVAVNAEAGSMLTWPQGNAFLVEALAHPVRDRIVPDHLAFAVRTAVDGVEVDVFDAVRSVSVTHRAAHVLVCAPQFVVERLLGGLTAERARDLHYAPWAVVNLTLEHVPEERGGEPMAWDNVCFGSGTLGYVNACQQRLDRPQGLVLTHYRALTAASPEEARKQARERVPAEWVEDALAELRVVHPGIDGLIASADVCIWGHGMVVPVPGLITGDVRRALARPINGRIHFAHSDLSGYSVFEEAFHHGRRAAREVLDAMHAPV